MLAVPAAGQLRGNQNINAVFEQHFVTATEHKFFQLQAGVGVLGREGFKHIKQHIVGVDGIDGGTHHRLHALIQRSGNLVDIFCLIQQLLGALQQNAAVFGEYRFAAFDFQQLHAQLFLQLVYAIADGRLTLKDGLGCLGVAAMVDHRFKHAPLFEGCFHWKAFS